MDRARRRIGLDDVGKLWWSRGTVTIAVLDSGIGQHPDLEGKCILFKDFINHKAKAYDDCGHGTHVCGILCGSGELSEGKYRGIFPGGRLIVGKVLDDKGDGSAEIMLEALQWVLKHYRRYDIRVLNISVGIGRLKDKAKEEKMRQLLDQLWDAGIVVVCAAGNKGPKPDSISAISTSQKVITVGCFDDFCDENKESNCALYSGRGKADAEIRKPDIVAPGTEIVSCNTYISRRGDAYENAYMMQSGTSMSTPIVAGCAALLLQKEPYLSNEKVKERIKYTAEDLKLPWNLQGWGMICAKRLLEIE